MALPSFSVSYIQRGHGEYKCMNAKRFFFLLFSCKLSRTMLKTFLNSAEFIRMFSK